MKQALLFSLIGLLLASQVASKSADCMSRLATLNFVDYVLCYDYPVETHIVTTQDGYKLTLFRIQAKNTKITSGKPVVLLWHGLLDSADSWVMNEEHIAPGFILANLGADIWFGNSRGNKYSLDHVSLNHKNSKDYWAFSWMQMSEGDLPAAFTYISEKTGQKINYVGHSQGTTQMFASLANSAGKNSVVTANLRKFAALGPVTHMANVKTKLMVLLANTPLLPEIMAEIGKYGIFNAGWVQSEAGRLLCKYMQWACTMGIQLVADVDASTDNLARLDVFAGHFPSGTSVTDIMHWKQEVQQSGRFQKFDYGSSENQKKYGQTTPPLYEATRITEEVGMFVGTGDMLADTFDAAKFYGEMVNAPKKEIHYYPIGHLTFLVGKTLPYMDDLIKFLDLPLKANRGFLEIMDV